MEDSKNVIALLYDIFLKNSLEDGSVDEKKTKGFWQTLQSLSLKEEQQGVSTEV